MAFNLLAEPWLPVRLRSGARRWIRPAQIVAELGDDFAVEPDWPRADFNIATYELLIGLLTIALHPREHEDWAGLWRTPPNVRALDEKFAACAHAFDLDGEGPRFLQEFGRLEGNQSPIESLLIDSPGENGQKKNSDVLTHRGRYPALSLPAAAIALYTMQAFAPPGGSGNRTSMRGGGPLTALAIPPALDQDRPTPLWFRVWANVSLRAEPPDLATRVFPWLAPRIAAAKGEKISETDPRVHPLHSFFGMPRRFHLVFSEQQMECPLLEIEAERVVTGVVQKRSGLDYGDWLHPLTPYRRKKEADSPYTAKPKTGRFGYRDWVATVVGDSTGKLRLAAKNIAAAREANRRREIVGTAPTARAKIIIAGWAMSNMEAIEYLLAEEPLHLADDPGLVEALDTLAREMARAGEEVHSALARAIKAALFGSDSKVATDKGVFEAARVAFYTGTDAHFHNLLSEAACVQSEDDFDKCEGALRERWRHCLREAALTEFDRAAPIPLGDPKKAESVVLGRAGLLSTLEGYGGAGAKLFETLRLITPKSSQPK
ncbi:MAG: type I-E CRISPR-associated protein Cse1/CasA [Pseudomonadota bacterium]